MAEKIFIWGMCAAVMLPSAIVDRKQKIIPNILSIGGSLAVIAARFLFFGENSPLIFVLCGIFGGGVFLLIERIFRGKLGFGDVKLSVFLGLCLGFWGWHISVFTASLLGIIIYFLKRDKKDKQIAFAPFLGIGNCTALVLLTLNIIPLPV